MVLRGSRRTTAGAVQLKHLVSKKKLRFIQDGFDLDLAYVLPDLIAMSVPATGVQALYRNPLSEVARFLESRHGPGGYTIINCCPELPYDGKPFAHGTVRRFDIQDHTPPTVAQVGNGRSNGRPTAAHRHTHVLHQRVSRLCSHTIISRL